MPEQPISVLRLALSSREWRGVVYFKHQALLQAATASRSSASSRGKKSRRAAHFTRYLRLKTRLRANMRLAWLKRPASLKAATMRRSCIDGEEPCRSSPLCVAPRWSRISLVVCRNSRWRARVSAPVFALFRACDGDSSLDRREDAACFGGEW